MAVYEALLLNTVVPQIQAAQAGDSYVMVVNATTDALRITQTGTGNALVVEDSSNPDATPFVVSAAGDVGIGTNAPAVKLDVNGDARVGGTSVSQSLLTIGGSSTSAAINLRGATGSAYAWQISSNSFVGSALEFTRSTAVGGTTFSSPSMLLTSTGTLNIVGAGTAGTTQAISFNGSTPVDTLVTTSGGNVGIGTSSPSLTGLAILSGGQGKGVLVARNATGSPTSGQSLGSYAFKGVMDGLNSNAAAEAMIEAVAAENQSGSTAATNLLFYTKPSGTGPGSSPTLRMTLDASGNLGLGVTPSAWTTNWKAFQFGATSALSDFSNQSSFWNNTVVTGATTPFYQTTAAASFYRQTGGQHLWYIAPSGTAGDAISFTQAMTLDASGRLLIGTTSSTVYYNSTQTYTASAVLKTNVSNEITDLVLINGNNDFGSTLDFARTNTSSNDVRFGLIGGVPTSNTAGSEAGYVYFSTKGTADTNVVERARITSGGDLLVGMTSTTPSNALGFAVNNSNAGISYTQIQHASGTASGASYGVFYYDASPIGSITQNGTTAVAYNTSSDYRLKDNPQPLANSGAFIDALKPKTWSWKADGSKGVGFIAHEAQEVSPSSVVGAKDAVDADGKPVMQAMEYGSAEFIANIVAELQSLRARVAQLEAK